MMFRWRPCFRPPPPSPNSAPQKACQAAAPPPELLRLSPQVCVTSLLPSPASLLQGLRVTWECFAQIKPGFINSV